MTGSLSPCHVGLGLTWRGSIGSENVNPGLVPGFVFVP